MTRRFLILAGLCVLLSAATQVFSQEAEQAPWITREGAVAMLIESKPAWRDQLATVRENMPPMSIYDDVNQNEWYAPYLEVAFSNGLIAATDFHREFRPGELLRQGEAVVLAARYRADGDTSKLPSEEPDHPLIVQLHVQSASAMGIALPEPLETWNVISRNDWLDLAGAAGVANPRAIAVVIPTRTQQPTVVVNQPVPSNGGTQSSGYKPIEAPLYIAQNPTYVPSAPSYVSNPAGSTPVRSDDSVFGPTPNYVGNPSWSQPVSSNTTVPTYAANPPGARPVSSNNTGTSGTTSNNSNSNSNSNNSNSGGSTTTAPNNRFSISIPSLGVSELTITHPSNVTTQAGLLAPLQYGVGHLFGYPGGGGKILIYGHSSSYSWDVSQYTKIFRQINKLNVGDRVSVNYGGKTYNYEVSYKQTVDASDMSAYQGGSSEELILYTCWPPDSIKQRYLVHAKPV